jgi:hypothetical protein
MTEENKKPEIVFAPGCFDHFDGTQEELDEFVAHVREMFEGKTPEEILEMGRPIDELSEEELEILEQITQEEKRNLQ